MASKVIQTERKVPGWAGVVLAYTGIALVMTWPLPLHLGSQIPYGGDALQFLWNMWWYRHALTAGTNPLFATSMYYPYGVSLRFGTTVPLESTLSVPFQLAGMGLISCYNILLLLSSIVGAIAVWALVSRATGSRAAGFVAGLAYGWSPYHSARLIGHLNLASHQWLPLYMLACIHTVDAIWPGAIEEGWHQRSEAVHPWRWAIATACAATATALSEWTYAAFAVLWTVGYLLYRGWPMLRDRDWPRLGRGGVVLGAIGAMVLVLTGPLLLPMVSELRSATYMIPDPAETLAYSADLASYLMPSELHPLLSEHVRQVIMRIANLPFLAERVVTIGYTVPLLGLLAISGWWRRRAVRFWTIAALGFVVLSVGPVLRVFGRTTWTTFHAAVLLPYALLYKLPGFAVMRTPVRFAVMVSLCAAVLAGYGVAALLGRYPRYGRLIVALCAVLILAEYWAPPQLIVPSPYPTADLLRADPVAGAVLDLPLRPMEDYMWYQTKHGRPIVGGFVPRQPPDRFASSNPAMIFLRATTPITADSDVRDLAGLRSLQAAGIRFVVVHWWATDDYRPVLERKLKVIFGDQQPIAEPADQASVYIIPAAVGTAGGGAPEPAAAQSDAFGAALHPALSRL